MEAKIEEFLQKFGKRLSSLTEEAFSTQVTSLIKLKECEDAHLGEEVERNWFEVVTQQYVFNRLNKEVMLPIFRTLSVFPNFLIFLVVRLHIFVAQLQQGGQNPGLEGHFPTCCPTNLRLKLHTA